MLFVGLVSITYGNTQSDTLSISEQINRDVWIPFMEAYQVDDGEKYAALHTDDVLRVTGGDILVGQEYKDRLIYWMSQPNRIKKEINFSFDQRVHSDSIGYEVGYYKLTYFPEGEDTRVSIGRFHVVLKKIDGVWKIAQDWDASQINGQEVTEADFDKGEKL